MPKVNYIDFAGSMDLEAWGVTCRIFACRSNIASGCNHAVPSQKVCTCFRNKNFGRLQHPLWKSFFYLRMDPADEIWSSKFCNVLQGLWKYAGFSLILCAVVLESVVHFKTVLLVLPMEAWTLSLHDRNQSTQVVNRKTFCLLFTSQFQHTS